MVEILRQGEGFENSSKLCPVAAPEAMLKLYLR